PPQAQIQTQPRIHPPVVLRESTPAIPAKVFEFAASLRELRRPSKNKIRDTVSGKLAVEGKVSVHLICVDDCIVQVHELQPEVQLMSAMDPGEILAPRRVSAVERSEMV